MKHNLKNKTVNNKTALIQVRIDIEKKHEMERVLSTLGLTTSQAMILYINQLVLKEEIPFPLNIKSTDPNLNEFYLEQASIVKKLDQGETIPDFHTRNVDKLNKK